MTNTNKIIYTLNDNGNIFEQMIYPKQLNEGDWEYYDEFVRYEEKNNILVKYTGYFEDDYDDDGNSVASDYVEYAERLGTIIDKKELTNDKSNSSTSSSK